MNGGDEQGNSSSRKSKESKESGGTIVIVDDACAGYFIHPPVFLGILISSKKVWRPPAIRFIQKIRAGNRSCQK
jgi:hypothetical protein